VLYRYFDDQAGLFTAVAQRIDGQFLRRLEFAGAGIAEPRDKLHALITEYLELIEADPAVYRFLEHQSVLDKRQVEYPSAATVDQARRIFANVLAPDESGGRQSLLLTGVLSMLRATADEWISTTPASARVNRIELARDLTTVLWSGLSAA